jgi:hypothetical protein
MDVERTEKRSLVARPGGEKNKEDLNECGCMMLKWT